jgi:hypothetical protein
MLSGITSFETLIWIELKGAWDAGFRVSFETLIWSELKVHGMM